MLLDWAWTVSLRVGTDSTTALTMATRHGHGRVKHMAIQYLWAQEVFRSGRANIEKVGTEVNRADLLTKHLARSRMESLLRAMGYRLEPAREPGPTAALVAPSRALTTPPCVEPRPGSGASRTGGDSGDPEGVPAPGP